MELFRIRNAEERDCALILRFVKELAAYEKLEEQVTATEAVLYESLFVKRQAEVLIGEEEGEPVAFALFFQNFSTFLGKGNLYLEDLFVKEECRQKGYGMAMLSHLATIAQKRGCERLDWWCLDWNEKSIAFYKRIGAKPMNDWTVYRLEKETICQLADGASEDKAFEA